MDLLKAHLHTHTHTFLENNLEIDLLPCISKPTRVTRTTATLIDNILISQKLQQNVKSNIIIDDISDHFPLLILLTNQRKSTHECKLIKTRKLDETALEKIRTDISSKDWSTELNTLSTNESFNLFHDYVCKQIDIHAPEVKRKISYRKVIRDPWVTKGIIISLRRQRLMYKKQLNSDTSVSTCNYKNYLNALKSLIRKSTKMYLHEKCLQYKQDSRKLWQLVNKLIGKQSNKILKYDPESITNEFCKFFSSIGEKYANKIQTQPNEINTYLNKMKECPNTMYLTLTSSLEIHNLIQKLPAKMSRQNETSRHSSLVQSKRS